MAAAGQATYARAAEPALAYAARLAGVRGEDQAALIRQAGVLLDRFAADLGRAGVPAAAIPPARLALGLVIDHRARQNRGLDPGLWAAGASRHLFDGREMSPAQLDDFIRRAETAGPDFAGLAGFLATCRAQLEGGRQRFDRQTEGGWLGIVAVLVAGFGLAALAWAGWVEWRFHRDLSRVFAAEALEIGLDRPTPPPDLAARLDRLQAAAARVESESARVPLRMAAGPLGYDAAELARTTYASAVNAHLPVVLAAALDEALATEGDPVAAWDSLRAVDVLDGGTGWSRAWLTGWVADRPALLPGLAPHVAVLDPPLQSLPADPELIAQARDIAAEAAEADLAFLELRRSDLAAGLLPWQAETQVPGLSDILRRKSGRDMADPLPGLFTQAGWTMARETGAGLAVQSAREQAARLLKTPPPRQNDAPDLVMAQLQAETLATWRDYLADLRVRPFADPEEAVRISGALARRDSALVALLTEVWHQAGGTDRRRSHAQQIAVAAEFAPMIQYVEQGRMSEIAALFAGLNVALGAMDRDAPTGMQRLMGVQGRAASVAALRQAPLVVVQIVEDVLAQTGAAQADLMSNPLTRAWQAEVLGACRGAIEGRFPFAAGPDADPAVVLRLLGPGGVADRFIKGRAAAYLDMTTQPWRWKPEARFAGLSPDSAEFLQRLAGLSDLFASGPETRLTFSALAERGAATIAIGGAGGPVETRSAPLSLAWPGPDPARGVEVSFRTPTGEARLSEAGPWGLLRLLGPLRLRERDGGRRFLVDLRTEGARLFVEIEVDRPANLLSRRMLLRDLSCAQVL